MATKPTTSPEWASANPTDPVSGQPAIIEPGAAKKGSGFDRLEKPNRQDWNWILNILAAWVNYLEQITDDNEAAIAPNTTHRGSSGTDHSDVGLNNTHRGSDGKDHSDVVLNNTHRSSDGKNHSDVVLNNAHRVIVTGNPHAVKATQITDFNTEVGNNLFVGNNTAHRQIVSGNPHGTSFGDLGLLNGSGTMAWEWATLKVGGTVHASSPGNGAAIPFTLTRILDIIVMKIGPTTVTNPSGSAQNALLRFTTPLEIQIGSGTKLVVGDFNAPKSGGGAQGIKIEPPTITQVKLFFLNASATIDTWQLNSGEVLTLPEVTFSYHG